MALSVKVGTYTGNGATSGTRAITGIGFQPKAVFVWSSDTVEIYPVFSFQSAITGLGANIGYLGENGWATGTAADRFNSFDTDGFTISCGSSATTGNKALNKNAATYYYLALGGTDVVTSSYTGNGSDNRSITGVGFKPIWAVVMGGTQHSRYKMSSTGDTTDSSQHFYNTANTANAIQQLLADGFEVGTDGMVNTSSTTYYYLCVNNVAGSVYNASYTGNGTDNRAITGFGFASEFIFIKGRSTENFGMRSSDHSGDNSKYYRSTGFVANYIQSIDADGMTIGNAGDINTNTATYDVLAFNTSSGAVTVNPTVQEITASIPVYTPKASSIINPATQVDTFSIPTYTTAQGVRVTANAQVATFTIPAYVVTEGATIVQPNTQAMTFSIPAYNSRTYVIVMPNGQELTYTLPARTINVTAFITVTPTTVSLVITTVGVQRIGAVWRKSGRNSSGDWTRISRNSD